MNSFSVNIREYLALGNDEEAGEPALLELLSGFSCPKNPAAWVLYSCIKAADSKGRNRKQYCEKKAIAG